MKPLLVANFFLTSIVLRHQEGFLMAALDVLIVLVVAYFIQDKPAK